MLLADLHPGAAARELSATRAAGLLRRVHPITVVDAERKRITRALLAYVRRLDRQVKTAGQAIRTAVREHGTTLTQAFGVGAVLAAAGPRRRHDWLLAATTSSATPVPPRSRPPAEMCAGIGWTEAAIAAQHRRASDAVCQIRDPSPGQAYYPRKLTQAKTREKPAAASNATPANIVHAISSPTTDVEPRELTYRGAIGSRSPDRWVPVDTLSSWPTDQLQGIR